MAVKDFHATWVDVYGSRRKESSNSYAYTGWGATSNWHTYIRIPDAVRTAANTSTTTPQLHMWIWFESGANEIDVGHHRESSSRAAGSTGLPWYSYRETWRKSSGSGWREYEMTNWFLPNFLSGNTRGVTLYSHNGAYNNTMYGLGRGSYNIQFRVTGNWNTPPTTPGNPRVDKSVADVSQVFRWDASTDAEQSQSQLRYDVEYYNGTSWRRMATGQAGTTYSHNVTNESSSGRKRYSVRAFDGEEYSSWINSPYFDISHVGPTFYSSYVNYRDINASTTNITGNNQHIIQGHSTLRVNIATAARGNDGKTIKGYTVTIGGQERNRSSTGVVDFSSIDASRNQTLTIVAEDSSGMKTSVSQTVIMIPYSPPNLIYSAQRLGSMSSETTLRLSGSISSLNNRNSLGTVRYRTMRRGSSYGGYITIPRSTSGDNFTTSDRTITLANTTSWTIHIEVKDRVTTRDVYINVNSGTPVTFTDIDLESFGIGKFPTREHSLETIGSIHADGKIYSGGDEVTTMTSGQTYNRGNWVRYSDGTQICTIQIPTTDNVSYTSYGAMYYNYLNPRHWDFPIAFADVPTVSYSAAWTNTLFTESRINASRVESMVAYYFVSGTSSATPVTVTATGRWK